ncbi:unnamed protein product [Danaus chrysippus]|uniref:(African queen) hypothetical protein n=1 Tax=Danaus chrysippus TaxID=151541 RepID=A0A8J2QVS4_9NEOP|nr:unnamed protein product [Danaus chrysippus]
MGKRSWKKTLINNLKSRRRKPSQEHLEEHRHQTDQDSQTSHNEESLNTKDNQDSARPTRAAKVRCLENLTDITRTERSSDLEVLRERAAQRIANENKEQRERRLQDLRQRAAERIATESNEQRERRLRDARQRAAKRVAKKNEELRIHRLEEQRRQYGRRDRALELNNCSPFDSVFIAPTYTGRLSELSQSMKRNIEDAYRIMEAYLSNTLYIADNNVTLADFSVFSTTSSLHGLHPIDSNKYPKLLSWYNRMSSLPVCKIINEPGAELHVTGLKKLMEHKKLSKL